MLPPATPVLEREGGFSVITKLTLATFGLALITTGCPRNMGPRAIVSDRPEYSAALSESWKEQMLLNIVKIRYADPPMFVDVGNIVSSMSLSRSAIVGGNIASGPSQSLTLGGSATLSNTPTITYTPLTGSRYMKTLMGPLPPDAVFYSIQSGQPADMIMFAALASINGLKNESASLSGITPTDPGFHQVRALVRKLQISGAVRMSVKEDSDSKPASVLTFQTKRVSPETMENINELRRLLGLNPDATEFKLVFGASASSDTEVAVLTRSILGLMQTMAAQVEVPHEDVTQTRALPGFETGHDVPGVDRLVRIHSAKAKPANSFVSVNYRGTWFWIDDRELQSKQVFSLMVMLFTMADTSPKEPLPLITIPAHP